MLLDGDSALRHVRVPRDFDGKSYGELFEHLLLYVKEREREGERGPFFVGERGGEGGRE